MMKPVNRMWRCGASVFCLPICSSFVRKEECPAFFVKSSRKNFTEDFSSFEDEVKPSRKRRTNGAVR